MSTYQLQNNVLSLEIDEQGAELISIKSFKSNKEYLWNADPSYWKRHSPILFPIVGSLKNQTYRYQGKDYSLPQHGFARDMKFTKINQTDTELWFALEAMEETLLKYPFQFRLEIGYRLDDNKITVLWNVTNEDNHTMYFSIGAHPAFLCPINLNDKATDYYFSFDSEKPLHYLLVNNKGELVKQPVDQQEILTTNHGLLPIDLHMFDQDALILEDNQCHKVSLVDSNKNPYVTVSFDAPLFGLWSPAGKNAPFICIEPWYGRCDANDFEGSLEEREWGNSLEPNEVFKASYDIEIN